MLGNNTKVLSREIRNIPRPGMSHEWILFTHSNKMTFEFIVCLFAHLEMSITALKYLDDARKVEMLVGGMLLCGYLNATMSLVEENKLPSSGTVFSLESQTLLSPWVTPLHLFGHRSKMAGSMAVLPLLSMTPQTSVCS